MVERSSTPLATEVPPALGDRDGFTAQVQYALARTLIEGLASLPIGAQEALIGSVARLAQRVDRRHTQSAERFIEQALGSDLDPGRRRELVQLAWRHFLRITVRSLGFDRHVPLDGASAHFRYVTHPEVDRALARPGGKLVVTAHLGDWEAGAIGCVLRGLRPFYAVSRPPRNRPLSRWFYEVRRRRDVHVFPRRGAMTDTPRILAAGGTVGLMIDQRPHGRALTAPFFGRPTRCERGVAVLLKRMRVPVVVGACFLEPEPYRFRVEIPEVLLPEEFAAQSLEAIMTRINATFERLIRSAPEQYFWLHDRWRGSESSQDGASGPEVGE
jgi:KDO2-lipid IV(A) lauroyltransferase